MAALSAQAAVVYKWVDADGVVHFSDQPIPGSERIVTSGSAKAATAPAGTAPTAGGYKPAAPKSAAVRHSAIESPTNEQVFFADDPVPVRLDLEPELRDSEEVFWSLNGAPLTDVGSASVAFSLPSLARGTYVLSVVIKDSESTDAVTPQSVTFYVRQPSDLAPLNPARKK